METILSRYRNITILGAVLLAQLVGLAFQVKRNSEAGPVRLVRVWTVSLITPLEKGVVHSTQAVSDLWHDYFWLRGARKENQQLKDEITQMRLEQLRLVQDAAQARRLQRLLAFKEQIVSQTVAAQVIGSSGSENSRTIYIDKGYEDGIRPDMAVINADGIVGKVLKAFHTGTSQVLLISDPSSGVGAILEKSRLQGILNGTAAGETMLKYVMADEKVETGELVLTSGGDRVFPKGLPVGTVSQVSPGPEMFLNIRVKPAANINRLEEILVITKVEELTPSAADAARAATSTADILAQRLPTIRVPAEGSSSATGIPPTMAELIRQQKAAAAAAARSTGVPPSTAELYGRKPAAAQPPSAVPGQARVVPAPSAGQRGASAPGAAATAATKPAAPASAPATATPNSTATRKPAIANPANGQPPAADSAPKPADSASQPAATGATRPAVDDRRPTTPPTTDPNTPPGRR